MLAGQMPVILLFGPPGCGKGTQAALLASRFAIPAISTGELFRAECQAGTVLGCVASSIVAQGGLVDDKIVNEMVANRTSAQDCASGFVLDGYPRTVPQAAFLDGLLRVRCLPKPVVIHLEVRPDVLVQRISMRRQCPKCSKIYNLLSHAPKTPGICDEDGATLVSRPDDSEAVVRERLRAYEELTGPVIAHYRGSNYHLVDGDRLPEEVQRKIALLLISASRKLAPPRRTRRQAGALSTPIRA
jgi:adenylate kinase